jgi:8-oxo-dGTP diphosphatase
VTQEVCTRIAGVLLVDSAGRLLLQLRDGNTRIDPHRWCLPGGHVDPGEDPVDAAHRELAEETGLKVERLDLFWRGIAPSARYRGALGEYHVFYAATDARDQDVVCGEGVGMWFTPPQRIRGLVFGRAYSMIVPRFLSSPQYRELVAAH